MKAFWIIFYVWAWLLLLVYSGHAQTAPKPDFKKFAALALADAGATALDGYTTANACRGCYEVVSPVLYGRQPSAGRTAAVMGAEFAVVTTLAYVLPRTPLRKFWWLPQVLHISTHATGGIHNEVIQ